MIDLVWEAKQSDNDYEFLLLQEFFFLVSFVIL